jgi:hypothetical protein
MNKGVEILLERMNSNPDEFGDNSHTQVYGRWNTILEKIEQRFQAIINNPDIERHWRYQVDFLEDEDVIALHNKLKSIRADDFTKDIMSKLLTEADDSSLERERRLTQANLANAIKHINAMSTPHTTPSKLTVSNEQVQAMKLYMEAEKLKVDKINAEANYNNSVARTFGKGK